jgi:hypothetical protein
VVLGGVKSEPRASNQGKNKGLGELRQYRPVDLVFLLAITLISDLTDEWVRYFYFRDFGSYIL